MKAEFQFSRIVNPLWATPGKNWDHIPVEEVSAIRPRVDNTLLVILENGKEWIAEREIRIVKTP